jgi:hypothetical protein
LQLSPYATALRAALLSPGSKASDEVRALLSLDPPNFRGAPEAWRDIRGEPGDAFHVSVQIRRWIAGKVHCRVERWQPPGYVPPAKSSGPRQPKAWYALAGTAPDGVVAREGGTTEAAVLLHRRRRGIAAFKAAKGGAS